MRGVKGAEGGACQRQAAEDRAGWGEQGRSLLNNLTGVPGPVWVVESEGVR